MTDPRQDPLRARAAAADRARGPDLPSAAGGSHRPWWSSPAPPGPRARPGNPRSSKSWFQPRPRFAPRGPSAPPGRPASSSPSQRRTPFKKHLRQRDFEAGVIDDRVTVGYRNRGLALPARPGPKRRLMGHELIEAWMPERSVLLNNRRRGFADRPPSRYGATAGWPKGRSIAGRKARASPRRGRGRRGTEGSVRRPLPRSRCAVGA